MTLAELPKFNRMNDCLNVANIDKFELVHSSDYTGPAYSVFQYILREYAGKMEMYHGDIYHDCITLNDMIKGGRFPVNYSTRDKLTGFMFRPEVYRPFCIMLRKQGTYYFETIDDLLRMTKDKICGGEYSREDHLDSLVFHTEPSLPYIGADFFTFEMKIYRVLKEKMIADLENK